MKIAIFSTTLDIKNGYGNITYEIYERLRGKVDFTLFLPESEKKNDYGKYFSANEAKKTVPNILLSMFYLISFFLSKQKFFELFAFTEKRNRSENNFSVFFYNHQRIW